MTQQETATRISELDKSIMEVLQRTDGAAALHWLKLVKEREQLKNKLETIKLLNTKKNNEKRATKNGAEKTCCNIQSKEKRPWYYARRISQTDGREPGNYNPLGKMRMFHWGGQAD